MEKLAQIPSTPVIMQLGPEMGKKFAKYAKESLSDPVKFENMHMFFDKYYNEVDRWTHDRKKSIEFTSDVVNLAKAASIKMSKGMSEEKAMEEFNKNVETTISKYTSSKAELNLAKEFLKKGYATDAVIMLDNSFTTFLTEQITRDIIPNGLAAYIIKSCTPALMAYVSEVKKP